MSYLELPQAPISDANKMIISFWFRDISQGTPPPAQVWPQGFWTAAVKDATMVPPNAQYSAAYDPAFDPPHSIFWWNSYGMPAGGIFFGNRFLSPPAVWIPYPPPLPVSTMRMLLTFGDPDQPYNYYQWSAYAPAIIDAVEYKGNIGPFGGFTSAEYPPPYAPYSGDPHDESPPPHTGILKNWSFKTDDFPTVKPKMVPQSFIGVDKDGFLIICLQTKTRGEYRGCSYQQKTPTEMWAEHAELDWTDPDNPVWVFFGGYWNGYQFEYEDISNKIMQASPECFVLGGLAHGWFAIDHGPQIKDGGWHHVLLSFDISGSVHMEHEATSNPNQINPVVSTGCKAWLAFDDVNYTDGNLQSPPFIYDGWVFGNFAKLEGTQTTAIIDSGPMSGNYRDQMKLGPNEIIPQNCWLNGQGMPRTGLLRYTSSTEILLSPEEAADAGVPVSPALGMGADPGDFNPLAWASNEWLGYSDRPGWHLPVLDPKKPTTPDPATTLDHPIMDFTGGFSIPLYGHPIGIPSSTHHIDHNTGVEMAELQIWIGQTIDTANEGLRRLFIDYPKDEDGNPDRTKPLESVPPKIAEAVLGKPDILLHGTSHWQKGLNTGTSGVDPDGNIKTEGQFQPVARIERFEPDPKLHQ
jgi:hypothetical protein